MSFQQAKSSPEEWRAIPGYEGSYEVSSLGKVRAVERTVKCGPSPGARRIPPSELSLAMDPRGRLVVGLLMNGRRKQFQVSVLVLMAFIGPRPDGHHGCHNNGVAFDNRLANLRWDTVSGNMLDKHLHGTMPVGTRNKNAKLTEESVRVMRLKRDAGSTLASLAKEFGVTECVASEACRRITWKHVA
jgi:hypothetical protein